nr:restriction endonuclease subunit S [Calidifontibacter indicus]
MGRKGNVGQTHLMIDGSWPTDTTYYVLMRDDIDPKFLQYQLISRDLRRLDSSTATPSLRRQDLESVPLTKPRLAEQRRIVEVLEDHLSRLDAAADYVSAAARRTTAMVASARQRLVIEASVSAATLTVGQLATVGTGTTPSRSASNYYDNGDIPWVTSGDLSQGTLIGAKQFVTDVALAETSLKLYPAGTLLVAMYGEGKTRGTVAELGIPATINQACAAIQVNDEHLRPWVRAVLEANYASMRRLAAGGVQPNLNLSLVRRISIPLPSAADRERLLAHTSTVLEAAASLHRRTHTVSLRQAALRRAVLAAAFNGKLTGHRTDDEVIEEQAEAMA